MQVDGYSLDAQKDKMHKYADYQEMVIVGEYSDDGKSGKSVEGRPQFQQMLQDIETGKDNVDFVLVFKLSRFGRNAADVLSSLQRIPDDYDDRFVYGIGMEDNFDESDKNIATVLKKRNHDSYLNKRMVIVLSDTARRDKFETK